VFDHHLSEAVLTLLPFSSMLCRCDALEEREISLVSVQPLSSRQTTVSLLLSSVLVVLLLLLFSFTFMQGIYNYTPRTRHVSRVIRLQLFCGYNLCYIKWQFPCITFGTFTLLLSVVFFLIVVFSCILIITQLLFQQNALVLIKSTRYYNLYFLSLYF
jgi:hypothetical protein